MEKARYITRINQNMRVFLKINLHILNVSLDNKSIFKENGKII
jgi:hypothetical protein